MLDVYRLLANQVGTADADELSQELSRWHDAMVLHERASCAEPDDCPHADARELWAAARRVFGDQAETLVFLRASADQPVAR